MNAVQRKRLLNVARALRETPDPSAFEMRWYCHDDASSTASCGTPACAAGNYAARRDLQRSFTLEELDSGGVSHEDWAWCEHFGITDTESDSLFSAHGELAEYCRTNRGAWSEPSYDPRLAAEYIERFVAERTP